ncbi:MAG TPA: M14 family zinc carboxypeptidase [Vicinamibacterales bacterium]|nr:M14 family zinc carboxypeptidase [Vicinamibacterales bacterium]
MRFIRSVTVLVLLTVGSPPLDAQRSTPVNSITPQELSRLWEAERVSPAEPPLLTHGEVVRRLQAVASATPDLFELEQIGESVEGRSINHLRAGAGPMPILLWSQMHGDEPTATAALFDIFEYLAKHRSDPPVRRILSQLTLHFVPMLNPDGAERSQRRNAQSIDINRDALRLQTPEGRALKALRDKLEPRIGFNLHNQSWGTAVGDPPKPASISLLSVAYDEKRSENAGRQLTKKLCAVIRDALEPFASGQIGRYDDEFEVRAFGDNITLWGTPVVLIETGAWPSEEPDSHLIRLNFIGILSALDALAGGSVNRADPRRYESLPMNESGLFYVLVRNATVINGAGVEPYIADIGISGNRRVRTVNGRRELQVAMSIADMGDLRKSGALRTIDATGLTAVPDTGYEIGATVDMPDWKKKGDAAIATGQPPRIALLRPAEDGKYRVEVVVK